MKNIERVLVVSRVSQYCREAVQNGISFAKRYGAELEVLYVISNPVDQEALNAPLPYRDERHKTYLSMEQETKEELDKILKKELNSGFPIKLIIKEGDPADEVVKVVKEDRIDVVVLLAHEESRLEHMLFGQETESIIRRLPCSILLVKREPSPVKW